MWVASSADPSRDRPIWPHTNNGAWTPSRSIFGRRERVGDRADPVADAPPFESGSISPSANDQEGAGAPDETGLLDGSMVIESMIAWSSARSAAVVRFGIRAKNVNRVPATSTA